MVFANLFFLFAFLPTFAVVYLLAGLFDKKLSPNKLAASNRCKNMALVVFSLIFYAWGEPFYVFLMLFSVMINYAAGLVIDRQDKHRKVALVAGLVSNVLILSVFKYTSMIVGTINALGMSIPDPRIALPIGISFYTFQSISYLVDVYKREAPVQKNFFDLLLYISMFPQLIAGPIVRYDTVANEIHNRKVSADDVADGVFRFLCGLGKKVILANQMSLIAEQFLVGGFKDCTTSGAWVGIIAYSMQVYFDFSGYSDMAIGIGRCLGFHFNENFTHPYCCNSITDFWHRWHRSLGSFFRDYVYIPLGGNRRHQWFNIMATWFLTGLWHGASWNFVLWGLYFGVILLIEKYTLMKKLGQPIPNPNGGKPRYKMVIDYVPAFFLHVYALFIITLGRGLFYFPDFGEMTEFFHKAFGGAAQLHDYGTVTALLDNFWLWVVCIIFCMPVREKAYEWFTRWQSPDTQTCRNVVFLSRLCISLCIIVLSVALLVGNTYNPFIYTRF